MLTPEELDTFPLFARLSAAGRRALSAGAQGHDCAPGGPILHKGQAISGAYLVLGGQLRVYTLTPNGAEATLYFIDPGETCVLALNCLFNDLRYPAWVQAEQPTRVALVPGPLYRRLFEQEPVIQDLTVRNLSTLVFRLMGELEQLHGSPQRRRLALFLLNHANGEGVLRMTQQQLAGHLGTSREVVARLIGDLVGRGLVQSRRGAVQIHDLDGLRREAAP